MKTVVQFYLVAVSVAMIGVVGVFPVVRCWTSLGTGPGLIQLNLFDHKTVIIIYL